MFGVWCFPRAIIQPSHRVGCFGCKTHIRSEQWLDKRAADILEPVDRQVRNTTEKIPLTNVAAENAW